MNRERAAPSRPVVVAIDGPSGSGKSTTARGVAERLGILFLDTGAMYRTLTLAALRAGTPLHDAAALAALARDLPLQLAPAGRGVRVRLGSEDVSDAIRSPEVTRSVSQVSAHAAVRHEMVQRQRRMGAAGAVVAEGRDIGTVVFPAADVKVFLTADAVMRARRRQQEEETAGRHRSLEEIEAELRRRDHEDSTRSVSPLVRAPDAVLLDTSAMSVEEEIEAVLALVRRTIQDPPRSALREVDPEAVAQPGYRRFYSGLHRFVHDAIRLFAWGWMGLRIVEHPGARLPGSVLVATNHISGWDPPLVGSSLPFECWYLAKLELFRKPWMARLIGRFNAIPIRRRSADFQTLERAVELLRNGRNVMMFLEGTRQIPGKLGEPRWGFGYVAARAGRPVLPVFVRGSRDARPRGLRRQPLEVWVGEPVDVSAVQGVDERETHRMVGEMVMDRIAGLMLRSAGRSPLPGLELPGSFGARVTDSPRR